VHDIVVLAGEHPWTWAVANSLRRRFGEVPIILEAQQSKALLLRHRIRRLGWLTVVGQLAFWLFAKAVRPGYRRREQEILSRESLDVSPIKADLIRVASVNDNQTIDKLRAFNPKVVIVSQTRIVARRVLASIPAVFINVHTGITPQYRGHHGAYWALVNGDPKNCGVCVHVVDPGVDTGPIIAQARIVPSPADSYFTYHWLQLAAALPLLTRAIEEALSGRLVTCKPRADVVSRQYYHPTLWGYLWSGLSRGVW
jgi:folate-dependent phosphoribosylglycinamide formyltransferase PurN